ncbi:MAG: Trk system potassium transporter TrkA [Clostridia bacterium]|nr:Trk system potassium transporter TrkA [Clostridia bacterium]
MKIIIVGCGKIGKSLIESLVSEGHDVAVIDKDPSVIEDATNTFDVIGLCGIGTDCEVLAEAGAARADIVISVTGSDELNMLSCFIARTLGAKNTVARIRDREYNDKSLGFMAGHLQLSMAINPEMATAHNITNILRFPSAINIDTFDSNKFEIVEMILGEKSPLAGMNMIDLRKRSPGKFLICAVLRKNEIIIPDGRFVLEDGDRIALTAAPNEIGKLLRSFDLITRKTKSVMILGASRIAYYLSSNLLAAGTKVTVIDKDEARCAEFAESLPGVTVIHGDGANQDMLVEEGLGQTDAFVSLTGYDENNILISYFATSQNVPKVISKVNRPEFYPIAGKLGIDTIISPIQTVADEMVRYARALQNSVGSNVEKLYKIMDGKAEALEFNVRPDFKHAGKALKEIKFKHNILIAGILRNRKPIVPSGNDVILPGDKVIVIAANHRLYDLSDIIE